MKTPPDSAAAIWLPRWGVTLPARRGQCDSGEVALSLDIRGPQDAPLDALLTELLIQAEEIAARRGLSFSAEEFYRIAATPCDARLQSLLGEAVTSVQGRTLSLPSGAGHDTIALAERWPVGMLFVRCRGISHHPAESVMAEDVARRLRRLGGR